MNPSPYDVDLDFMITGRGKDIVELAVIQADGAFDGWLTESCPVCHGAGKIEGALCPNDCYHGGVEVPDSRETSEDAVEVVLMDLGMPLENGW